MLRNSMHHVEVEYSDRIRKSAKSLPPCLILENSEGRKFSFK